jgi:hypothetical protein
MTQESHYDSTQGTLEHIREVQRRLIWFAFKLLGRAIKHDRSKLLPPEKEVFDQVVPRLKELTYGSKEYMAQLEEMQVALRHHYAANNHHPEHWGSGVNDMSLVDIVEMLCDWCAAVERHEDGDIFESLKINKERFKLTGQLADVIANTVVREEVSIREEVLRCWDSS